MSKASSNSVLIPTILLKDGLIHLPGVILNLSVSSVDAFKILDSFLQHPKILSPTIKKSLELLKTNITIGKIENSSDQTPPFQLSKEAEDGINTINTLLGANDRKSPVFAVLTSNSTSFNTKVAVISRLVGIRLLPNQCILSLKGSCKGYLFDDIDLSKIKHSASKFNYMGELLYEVEIKDTMPSNEKNLELSAKVISAIRNNLSLSEEFMNDYSQIGNSDFKNLLYRLNPLSELLHIQLSDPNTLENLQKLKKLVGSLKKHNLTQVLNACDIYVSVFPFSYKHVLEYLETREQSDSLLKMVELTNFVSTIFGEYLNVTYVFDSWTRLGRLQNGKALQSRFIVNHFNTLKQLLDGMANKNIKNGVDKPRSMDGSPDGGRGIPNKSRPASGDEDDDLQNIENFILKLNEYSISEDGKMALLRDFKRLKKMQSTSTEYQQLRNYMDIIMELPWSIVKKDQKLEIDLGNAKRILNDDHFGMESAKERILEHLAILKLTETSTEKIKSPILLLNGPPGVGKTSLGKSIAHSLNCEFQRISLGGINDFSDIKGHRRTYVGAIPGLLVQALRRCKTMNPVILLDEIDKIGMGNNKGNPAAALLEILDPEQNVNFTDHFVGFPIDLSKIVFIATSNNKWEIDEPLLDRMETIDLDGYNFKEKVQIAQQYILPRQKLRNGLKGDQLVMDKDVFKSVATLYTHEAGIRNFERLIAKICRKKAVELLTSKNKHYKAVVSSDDLIKYLGVPRSFSDASKYSLGNSSVQENFGMVNGLSYNSDGSGSLLKFEMVGVPGSQGISCTGRLGEVLLESCEIAETLVEHLINTHLFVNYDSETLRQRLENTHVHMHVPEGSVKKDGPSAGLTMALCYLSLILQRPVNSNIAMTGELTLTAKALPIGGLKEKLLGASMSENVRTVLAPRLNRNDMISAYAESLKNREEAKIVLTKLVLEEQQCLFDKRKRYTFSTVVEEWIKDEYGVDIKYVDDFTDVIREVWGGDLVLLRKELKAHL